jgi:hypothetical protein
MNMTVLLPAGNVSAGRGGPDYTRRMAVVAEVCGCGEKAQRADEGCEQGADVGGGVGGGDTFEDTAPLQVWDCVTTRSGSTRRTGILF